MACLHVVSDRGDAFDQPLEGDSLTIGRSSKADLQLADRLLSRVHLRVFCQESTWWVEDLDSRNGTLLNGVKVQQPKRLSLGDELRVCRNTLVFGDDDELESLETTQTGRAESLFVEAEELDRWTRPAIDLGPGAEGDLAHRAEMLSMLNEIHRALSSPMDLDQLLELLLDRAFEVLAPDEALIFLRAEDGGFYRAAERTEAEVDAEHLYSKTLLHEVAEKGMAALVTDVPKDPLFGQADSVLAHQIRSLAAAPLAAQAPLGMIVITSIGRMAPFQQEDVELLVSLASIAAMRIRNIELAARAAAEAADRARLEGELSLARQIQLKLLPSQLPEIPGYEVYGANVPSRGVSGDFYTVIERPSTGECIFLLADVSGKGMAASLITCSLEALAAGPIEVGRSPLEITCRVSRRLMRRTLPERFATMFVGALQPEEHVLSYTNAGQNPPLLLSLDGKNRWIEATGPPIALLQNPEYAEAAIELAPGDLLVLYTDGVTEAFDARDEEFGSERLLEVCRKFNQDPLDRIATKLRAALDAFVQDVPYADDQTLLLLRRL